MYSIVLFRVNHVLQPLHTFCNMCYSLGVRSNILLQKSDCSAAISVSLPKPTKSFNQYHHSINHRSHTVIQYTQILSVCTMPSYKAILTASLTTLLITTPGATAIPYTSPDTSNDVTVYIRDTSFAYTASHEMAHAIKAREAELPLQKRSKAKVRACYDPACAHCYNVWPEASFTSNTACIPALDTACLIISNLKDASVKYWNHVGCNGRESTFDGCPKGAIKQGAPGTNSIGVHVGC